MIGPFLIRLVEEPQLLDAYMRDPDVAMEAEGLSREERAIVLSGSLKQLRDALQKEYPDKEIFLGKVPQVLGQAPHFAPGDGDDDDD